MNKIFKTIVNWFDVRVYFIILAYGVRDVNILHEAVDKAAKPDGRYSILAIENEQYVTEISCKYNSYRAILAELEKNGKYLKTVTDMGRISGIVCNYSER